MLDRKTVYYFSYCVCALLSVVKSRLFSPFLLLDIVVKNSTTRCSHMRLLCDQALSALVSPSYVVALHDRDVLFAVLYPAKQLGMTLVLLSFVVYIYASFIFFIFPNDPVISEPVCHTLAGCMMFSFDYGLRLSGGVGDDLTFMITGRAWLDLTYFITVVLVLLNVIFGIIIDTFGELRSARGLEHAPPPYLSRLLLLIVFSIPLCPQKQEARKVTRHQGEVLHLRDRQDYLRP